MRYSPIHGTLFFREIVARIAARLPMGWSLRAEDLAGPFDARLTFTGPDGSQGTAMVELKRVLTPKQVDALDFRLSLRDEAPTLLVVAPFMSAETRGRLANLGASYADATGNLRLVLEKPAIFMESCGDDRNPWREPRELGSLKGPAAGRVIRALCDHKPPYGLRELAQTAHLPLGTASRTIELLDREGLVQRSKRGGIVSTDWRGILARWTQDYDYLKANPIGLFLDPRGLPAVLQKLRAWKGTYAVTASLAAASRVEGLSPRLAVVYVEDLPLAAKELRLTEVEQGANVILVQPKSNVPFERHWEKDDVTYVALSQVAADLQTSPGRGLSEADALMRWMAEHEEEWRA